MEDSETNQSVVAIAGMHRSGTSLVASLLQSSGVFIGDRLMAGGTGNAKGHFEDWDFVDLHRDTLTAQGIDREGWTTSTGLSFDNEYLERAKALIAARHRYLVWGWKDPRTTLFLECWSRLIFEVKFVFVYRSPWDVVDSLFRRGDLIFRSNPKIAIQSWISYNQAILRFCQQTDKPWILFKIEDVIQSPEQAIEVVNRQLSLNLRSPQPLCARSLLRSNMVSLRRKALIEQYFPQAYRLYRQLHQLSNLVKESTTDTAKSDCSPWYWQNWIDRPVTRIRTTKAWHRLESAIAKDSNI